MKDLLQYILENILGSKDFEISELAEGDRSEFVARVPQDQVGLVIGKGGRTIRAIRNLLRVKATLQKKGFYLSVEELS